jgi:hypothetical protein
MTFMRSDEDFLILMNLNVSMMGTISFYKVNLSDLIRCHQAGIRTVLEYPGWNIIEPEKGVYDFSSVERTLDINRSVGMKTIFSIPEFTYPAWMPDEWFAKNIKGEIERRYFSMWNVEAQDYLHNYCKFFIDNFDAPDVLFIFAEGENGENILPTLPSFYDDAALMDYRSKYGSDAVPDITYLTTYPQTKEWLGKKALDHFMMTERFFYPHKHEIWDMKQWLYNQWSEATINYIQPELMALYRTFWKDANIVLLQYTYFDEAHGAGNVTYVDNLKDKIPCDVIVEAHFCSGLRSTTPRAIAKGFRGQIICPTHPMSGRNSIDMQMIDDIRWSCDTWKRSKVG